MKNIAIIILIFCCSSCWAPRCPISTCRTTLEHQHGDLVTGVFRGKNEITPKVHFLWDKNKGEKNPNTDFKASGGPSKRQVRKKFPWEKW